MTNLERLQIKVDELKKAGLSNVNFDIGSLERVTPEEVAGEMLRFIEAVQAGNGRPLEFSDSQKVGV